MAAPNPPSSPLPAAPLSASPLSSQDLNASPVELFDRLRGLTTDMQTWKSRLETQVKTYQDEISELKRTLNFDLDQLRLDFKELKTTLQKQQVDVTTNLKNLGMQEACTCSLESENHDMKTGLQK